MTTLEKKIMAMRVANLIIEQLTYTTDANVLMSWGIRRHGAGYVRGRDGIEMPCLILDAKCVNKNSSAYKLQSEWLAKDGNTIIRPCWTSGRGRYCTNLDYTTQTVTLLELLHVRYEVGNDAPRGGITGNFIKIKL